MSAQRATPRVVIEYEFLGYTPPDDAEAFYVDAVVTHTDVSQLVGGNLMFVRQELAERDFAQHGARQIRRQSYGRYYPRWREVWVLH